MRGNERAAPLPQGGGTRTRASNAHSPGDSTPTGRRTQGGGRPVFTDHGKFAGTVFRDGSFFKAIPGSRHMLRVPPSIAYDVTVLQRAEALGGTRLVVVDRETGVRYEAPMPLTWSRGFRVNRGYGEQRALVLHHWRIDGSQAEAHPEPKRTSAVQLSLLGARP